MAKKLSPPEVIRNLTIGYWIARLIHVAAKLKLADLLKKGPRPIEDLAMAAGVQPAMLYRILRALASVGVFAETKNRRFTLTPLAATLQTGVPASMHAWALMINEDWGWDAWKELLNGVKTSEVPFLKAHGVPLFEYFEKHSRGPSSLWRIDDQHFHDREPDNPSRIYILQNPHPGRCRRWTRQPPRLYSQEQPKTKGCALRPTFCHCPR
jgi:hypothetical protein